MKVLGIIYALALAGYLLAMWPIVQRGLVPRWLSIGLTVFGVAGATLAYLVWSWVLRR